MNVLQLKQQMYGEEKQDGLMFNQGSHYYSFEWNLKLSLRTHKSMELSRKRRLGRESKKCFYSEQN